MTTQIDNLLDTVICGDVFDKMPEIPTGTVHCVITSPPYWGLRDYGVEGQIGLEKTPEEYIAKMVAVFREVWRVLRDDGTLWLNLGDTYYMTSVRGGNKPGKDNFSHYTTANKGAYQRPKVDNLKPKDLCGIPWRVALALQADGWYLRQDIIWAKPNPMPESVTDRCTKAHEYIFLLTKSGTPQTWTNNKLAISTVIQPKGTQGVENEDWEWVEHAGCKGAGCDNKRCINGKVKTSLWAGHDYYYDAEAIKEKSSTPWHGVGGYRCGNIDNSHRPEEYRDDERETTTRNKRSVWTVPTAPYKEAHFATFPPKLIEPCILAGCPEWVCKKCGEPRRRITETTQIKRRRKTSTTRPCDDRSPSANDVAGTESKTVGWTDCGCNAGFDGGIVLDPFMGSGTVAAMAYENNRHYVGIDLNPDRKIQKRITDVHDKYALFEPEIARARIQHEKD